MIDYIDNHIQIVNDNLVEQYKESYNLKQMLEAFCLPLQQIEDEGQNLYTNRRIDKAVGVNLDKVGALVGADRNYKSDSDYRRAIYARIIINNGGGSPEDIITAIKLTYAPSNIIYSEIYPASFVIFLEGDTFPKGAASLINSIRPLGTNGLVTYSSDTDFFKFSEVTSDSFDFCVQDTSNSEINMILDDLSQFVVEADTTDIHVGSLGFGEFGLTNGGKLAEVIRNA